MALPAAASSPSPLFRRRVKLLKPQSSPNHLNTLRELFACSRNPSRSVVKASMAAFGDLNNAKEQISLARQKLWETIPDPVKEIQWKKAEEQLLVSGKKALKWSLIVLFALSSLSDVLLSISRSKELMIPAGLLIGYLTTDLLREIVKEFSSSSREEPLEKKSLIGIGSFFVLVKLISSFFAISVHVFLLHVANGGLMEVLWLWRSLPREGEQSN